MRCGRSSGGHMYMGCARFSPGSSLGWMRDAEGRRARSAFSGNASWKGNLSGSGDNPGAASCLRCVVPPARCAHPCAYAVRSPSTCKSVPLARNRGVVASGKELVSHRWRGIELAALPPSSAVGGVPHGPSAWACDAGGPAADICAWVAGAGRVRHLVRHEAAPGLSSDPLSFCFQLSLKNDCSARGGLQRLAHNPAKSPAKSERNPCTCVRRWPARLPGPSPFASK